jgi:hypothetical protein
VSARHLSFIESGRASPSPGMVLRLAATLDVPLRERNRLLVAAGHAPRYQERALSSGELGPFRRVLRTMLDRHEPYPGLVLDRGWRIVDANRGASRVFEGLTAGACAIELFVSMPLYAHLVNRDEVRWSVLSRIRHECASAPHDESLRELLQRAEHWLGPGPEPEPDVGTTVICPRFDVGGQRIETVTVMTRFGAAQDITLDELRLELTFPTNPGAEALFMSKQGRLG